MQSLCLCNICRTFRATASSWRRPPTPHRLRPPLRGSGLPDSERNWQPSVPPPQLPPQLPGAMSLQHVVSIIWAGLHWLYWFGTAESNCMLNNSHTLSLIDTSQYLGLSRHCNAPSSSDQLPRM
jgi:hypothetical protein